MKTAIVYSSSHGTTEKAAQLLKENLVGEVDLINLKKNPDPDMGEYGTVIVGSSIHAGSIQAKVRSFIGKNLNVLLNKKIGLFLCCMYEGEDARKQFEKGYPEELRKAALAQGLFGGEFIFSKMNFIERQIIKKISGVTSDVSKIDYDVIKKFASQFNN